MNKLEQAARQALEALEELHYSSGTVVAVRMYESATAALREALEQHKPHEECECSACLNYFTDKAHEEALEQPVSQQYQDHLVNQSFDWSAMAAKHQFMEGYRIGLAEMREKCATVSEQGTGEAVQKAALELLLNERKRIASAIRAIKFEGDTGFRPVSEMIAEHKKDPKKAAAIERARERLANKLEIVSQEPKSDCPCCGAKSSVLPMAFCRECKSEFWPPHPVRTKDLTDDEIEAIMVEQGDLRTTAFARAVIAADREKNK